MLMHLDDMRKKSLKGNGAFAQTFARELRSELAAEVADCLSRKSSVMTLHIKDRHKRYADGIVAYLNRWYRYSLVYDPELGLITQDLT